MRNCIAATLLFSLIGLGGVQARNIDGVMGNLPLDRISDLAA